MKAMVFAAGVGSRLKEITKDIPKCLVPLDDGTTMLDRVIERLKYVGVTEIVINLFHLGEKIREHIEKKNSFGIAIHFAYEETLLGTGGGLKNVRSHFEGGESFFVHNSDVFSEIDLSELYAVHQRRQGAATLACMARPTSRHLLFDKDKKLVGWENDGKGVQATSQDIQYRFGFSGIQVISPKLFQYMKDLSGDFSIISAYMKASEAGESVYAHDIGRSYWLDMGTPERLQELKNHLASKT